MRNLRLLSVLLAALLLTLALAAGSAARTSGQATAAQERPIPPAPASSQPAPAALPTSPAATQRTFVSGGGNDANPCTRTAPCRNFTKAISETLPNGEVIALDSAGYGPFTVDKSVDIIAAPGAYAGVTVFSGDAITVNAAPTDRVVLRGLTLNALGGNFGIRVLGVGTLSVQQMVIKRFTASGIYVDVGTGSPHVFIDDTLVLENGNNGILFNSGTTKGSLDHVRLERNGWGLGVFNGARVKARDTLAVGTSNHGFFASGAGTQLSLERAFSTENQVGVESSTGAIVRFSETMVTNNDYGLVTTGGSILSWGTNRVNGNFISDGAPTSTIPQV